MKYLCNINLLSNELQNAVIQNLAVAPENAKAGQIYYNSADKYIYRYDGANWSPVGVIYNQNSTTGAVITGLDDKGNVTTTNVIGLTLTGYTPVEDGYVSADMTIEAALKALDEAVKNAVAGGGEINQNAFSNVTVKQQSDAVTAVAGQAADATIAATAKIDTITMATGNKWVDVNGTGKTITVGHALSGVTAGTTGDASHVAKVTVDEAGHVTAVESAAITPAAIGADVAGAAEAVKGTPADAAGSATVYGALASAEEAKTAAENAQSAADGKVASVSATADKGIEIAGTATAPTIGIKLDSKSGNAATLSADGLMVTIPEVDIPEYSIVKLDTATEGYIATYQLQKAGVQAGVNIDIPKDYLVKSAELKTSTGDDDASGLPAGTKYIDFTINTKVGTGNVDHIYLNVEDLVDVYTAGNGIEISDANIVSAKVVAANGLSVDATGIKLSLASATAAGAMSSNHFTKLESIDEGATKDTITLNGTETKTPNFYAPVTGGTAGQHLVSNGNAVPTWQNMPVILKNYTATNGALTAAGGAFTWTIAAATHGISNNNILVNLYEVATGAMVIADVVVNQTNYAVTITINDVASAGTLAAGTYKVVMVG